MYKDTFLLPITENISANGFILSAKNITIRIIAINGSMKDKKIGYSQPIRHLLFSPIVIKESLSLYD